MALQLRLWLTVVVIVVTGVFVLLLGTSALHEKIMLPFETVSSQAVTAVNGAIIRHGADAVDAVTRASVDPAVRLAAAKGEMTPAAEAALLSPAGAQGAPGFALLVKPDGSIIARAGADVKFENPLTGFPLFAEAATGLARDGVQFLPGTAAAGGAWHLAGAPVYEGATLSSIIILGWAYDGAFADRIAKIVGAPVVLVSKDARAGSSVPELTPELLKVRGVGVGTLALSPLPKMFPILMPERGRYSLVGQPLFGGEQQLALVVATDRNEAFRAIGSAQAGVILGTMLLALLQLVLIWSTLRTVSRPIEIIVDHLSQVSQGNSVGILPEAALSGQFLRLGKQVNMILQMMPSSARSGAPLGTLGSLGSLGGPPLGSLGGPTLNAPVPTPTLGGLGAGDALSSAAPRPTPAPSFGAIGPPSLPSPPEARGGASAQPSGLSSLFDDAAPDPLAAFRVPSKPVPPPAPLTQPPTQPPQNAGELPNLEDSHPGPLSPEATVMFQVPQELLKQSAQSGSIPAAPASTPSTGTNNSVPPSPTLASGPPPGMPSFPGLPKMTDDARTVVAQVPQELLAGISREAVSNADEQHYKEVYEKFVETRVQCGEDTSDLTYDRFVAKLLKNRQQIVEKHKAKSVRFQVYVKEGKAALRALPVRE